MCAKMISLLCLVSVPGLAQANAASPQPVPLRLQLDPSKPMHIHGANALSALVPVWHQVPANIRPVSVLELDNYDNSARAVRFEKCIKICQENGIPVVPEIVREGTMNETINVSWLDGMFKKYSTIVAVVFDCNAPNQLDTSMMREYLEVCGQNGAYFFFNMENKAVTHPEDIDKMFADPDLLATMKKYHQNIVVSYYGGGMRGIPTDAQKAENLKKLTKMLADGLIGRIGYYYYQIRGSDVDRERASGCTTFGGNELQEARNADYWESLRKVVGVR